LKLAVAIAAKDALPSAFVVWRGFEESIKKAREYGYHGVELALKTADDVNPEELTKWLDKYHMEVSCISTGQVFAALGLYFTHPDREVRQQTINVFHGLIHLAKDFGKLVNVGRTRGFIAEGSSYEKTEKLFVETAESICEEAEKCDVTVVLEPVNRYEINFVNSLDDGMRLISRVKSHRMGLMPDVFHMNIEDDRIGDSLIRNAPLIQYIHLADSNRLAPGWGHMNFTEIFDALQQIEYNGWASVEILPKPDPDQAARQAARFLLPMIEEYNHKMGKNRL